MDAGGANSDLYTEKLMNMILDEIDDLIIIHDSQHTIIWMNRAAEKAFGKSCEDVIGDRCYSLFGNGSSCKDCSVTTIAVGRTDPANNRRVLPDGTVCECVTLPYYEGSEIKLLVQHLKPIRS